MIWNYGNQEGDWLTQAMMQNSMLKGRRDANIAGQFYQAGR